MGTPIYTPEDLQLGPCNVYFFEAGSDASIGITGDVTVKMGTDAVPLTGAQFGTVPLDKIITGGHFQFTISFKEITLQNLARAYPNCVITTVAGPGGQRVDFKPLVGQSMRALAKKATIKAAVGGVDTTEKEQIIVVSLASPIEGEISLAYQPTTQREIVATFETWPDANNRWGYMGDELAS